MTVKWKIYLIAIISIAGFGAYLAFNLWVSSNNAKIMAQVRDTYFPVLEKASENTVSLDRLTEQFNVAVQTGEEEYFLLALETAETMNAIFDDIYQLQPSSENYVSKIQIEFNSYLEKTISITEKFMDENADFNSLLTEVVEKEKSLQSMREKLEEFRVYSSTNFLNDIDQANANSKMSLRFGLFIWLGSILLLASTVYFIARIILRRINQVSKSLSSMAMDEHSEIHEIHVIYNDEIGHLIESFNQLMHKVRERANDLSAMMDNMHQGIFTVLEDGAIHKEYARYLEDIFDVSSISNKNFRDILFSNALLGSDQIEQIVTAVLSSFGVEEMVFEFNKHLLIKEYKLGSIDGDSAVQQKIIELEWDPIYRNDAVYKLMVTVRDVTHIRALKEAAEADKEQLEMIGEILNIPSRKFDRFIENSERHIDRCRELIGSSTQFFRAVVDKLFVHMHTLKGNARTYKLNKVTDIVHEVEGTYDSLRMNPPETWDQAALLAELDTVSNVVTQYKQLKEDKLTVMESHPQRDLSDHIIVNRNQYKKILSNFDDVLNAMDSENGRSVISQIDSLRVQISKLDSVSLEEIVRDSYSALSSMAMQLGKKNPELCLNVSNIMIPNHYEALIKDIFVHLLSNSISHGIEVPEQRREKAKREAGKITINACCNVNPFLCEIELFDDGAGLNIEKLASIALEKNKLSSADLESPTLVANTIFNSGISTTHKLSNISGRGVGLDAVKTFLNDHGGDIRIELSENQPTKRDFFSFKFVFDITSLVIKVAREEAA